MSGDLRPMYVAADWGGFYPESESRCSRLIEQCLGGARRVTPRGEVLGGFVPHAGWVYSGKTAASTFIQLDPQAIDTVVIFGAVHVPGVRQPSIWNAGAWETPLGQMSIDIELAAAVAGDTVFADFEPHRGEHAIEVELPFQKQLLPSARLLPISVPPDSRGIDVGRLVAAEAQRLERRVVALGSTDLTHYGERFGFAPQGIGRKAHAWVKEVNDRGVIDAIEALDAEGVIDEVARNRNACGSGAIAATITFVNALGATHGQLIHHTSSLEVRPEIQSDSFVGYASLLFCA